MKLNEAWQSPKNASSWTPLRGIVRFPHIRFLTESDCAILAAWCVLGVTNPGRKGRRLLKAELMMALNAGGSGQ